MDIPLLFIYSSVDGHLGCSHFLVTVINSAVNIRVRGFFCLFVCFVFSIYLAILGLCCSMHTLSCSMWDLVP